MTTQANNVAIESSQINSSGVLQVAGGGTGLATLTANYVPYGNGTSALQSLSTFNFNGTTLSAPVVNASQGFHVNAKTNSASYSLPSGFNMMSVGPFTIASGTTVTVATGSRWVVL